MPPYRTIPSPEEPILLDAGISQLDLMTQQLSHYPQPIKPSELT
jgi:hypothetical protein